MLHYYKLKRKSEENGNMMPTTSRVETTEEDEVTSVPRTMEGSRQL